MEVQDLAYLLKGGLYQVGGDHVPGGGREPSVSLQRELECGVVL